MGNNLYDPREPPDVSKWVINLLQVGSIVDLSLDHLQEPLATRTRLGDFSQAGATLSHRQRLSVALDELDESSNASLPCHR